MPKAVSTFTCQKCNNSFPKWTGKCPSCSEWNSLEESAPASITGHARDYKIPGNDLVKTQKSEPHPQTVSSRVSSGIEEVDRVIGGGFSPGSLILFGGNPGIGKSTLALQLFLNIKEALYFSGEESIEQIKSRASRLSPDSTSQIPPSIFSTNSLEDILHTIQAHKPPLAIIDSIQMVGLSSSSLGSVSNIRENAELLLKLAKVTGTTIVLIGHVTKAEELAGPKILEHIVDVVLQLEGERTTELRILRSPKNRFGSTLEVGVFEMTGTGLKQLQSPSEFFLAQRPQQASGSAITVVREGSRNFLLEIQVLTTKTNFGQPRRTSHGVSLSKLHLLLAVVSKFTPFKCHEYDAYLNIVGGLRIQEPAGDLAICAALLSSRAEKEIPADTAIFGEVGLSGEVRRVPHIEQRLAEAEKMGFKKVVMPKMSEKVKVSVELQIVQVNSVIEMLKVLF